MNILKNVTIIFILIIVSSACGTKWFIIGNKRDKIERTVRIQGGDNIIPGDTIALINVKGEYFGFLLHDKANLGRVSYPMNYAVLKPGKLKRKNLTLTTEHPGYISDTIKIKRSLRFGPLIGDLALTGLSGGWLAPVIGLDFYNNNIWKIKKRNSVVNTVLTPKYEYFAQKVDTLASHFMNQTATNDEKDKILNDLLLMHELYSQETFSVKSSATINQLSQTYAKNLVEVMNIDKLKFWSGKLNAPFRDVFVDAENKCLIEIKNYNDSIINIVTKNIDDRIKIINSLCEYQLLFLNDFYKIKYNSLMDFLLFKDDSKFLTELGDWYHDEFEYSSKQLENFYHYKIFLNRPFPPEFSSLEKFEVSNDKYLNWNRVIWSYAAEVSKKKAEKQIFEMQNYEDGLKVIFDPLMDFRTDERHPSKMYKFSEVFFQMKRIQELIQEYNINCDYELLFNKFKERDLMLLIAFDNGVRVLNLGEFVASKGYEKNSRTFPAITREAYKKNICQSKIWTKKEFLFFEAEFKSIKWKKYFEDLRRELSNAIEKNKRLAYSTVARFIKNFDMFYSLDNPNYVVVKSDYTHDSFLNRSDKYVIDSIGKKYAYSWNRFDGCKYDRNSEKLKQFSFRTIRPTFIFSGDTITEIMTNINDPNEFIKQSYVVNGFYKNLNFRNPTGRIDESAQKSYNDINKARREGKINAVEEAMLLNRVKDNSNYDEGTPDLPSMYWDLKYLGHEGELKDEDLNRFFLCVKSWKGFNLNFLFSQSTYYLLYEDYKK
jgi:hypothetical protein